MVRDNGRKDRRYGSVRVRVRDVPTGELGEGV